MNRRWVPRAIGLPVLLLDRSRVPAAPSLNEAAAAGPFKSLLRRLPQRKDRSRATSCSARSIPRRSVPMPNIGNWSSASFARGPCRPAGRPRPSEAAYDGLIAHLETSLDRAAAANPDPGRTDTFRRLNRTEYRNAIRDLLDVEIDAAAMLPSDDSSHGFDNISVGGLSPMLLERYLSAAQKISRLAVGTPVRSAGQETIVLPPDLTQEDHFDGQPFGTRAGTSVRYTFPADGEYQFELRLTRDRNELIEGLTEPHQVEVSVDGVRQQVFTLTPAPRAIDAGRGRAAVRARAGSRCAPQSEGARNGRAPCRPGRLHQTAVGAGRNGAPAVCGQLQQRSNAPHAAGAVQRLDRRAVQPAGVGDTPSRKRIFSCRPGESRADEDVVRAHDSVDDGAPRVSAARDRRPRCRRSSISTSRGALTAPSSTASKWRLRAMLTSPAFLFRIERDPPPLKLRRASPARIALTISSLRRGCRFSCGAAFPTISFSMPR